MVKRILCSLVLVGACAAPAFAQSTFADMIDHLHLSAPDQAKGVEWYHKYLDAQITPEGPDRAMLGTTRLIFQKTPAPKPSEKSVLNMLGFSVADLDGTVKKMQADGVTIAMPPMMMGGVRSAYIVDPWGMAIELVQDPRKLGLHHIYLQSPNPTATLAWFADKFNGKVAKYNNDTPGINFGGVWLLAKKGEAQPSAGHAFDHIGFRPLNVDEAVAALKVKKVKIEAEPRPLTLPSGTRMRLAFVESPEGARIELVQRDNLPPDPATSK